MQVFTWRFLPTGFGSPAEKKILRWLDQRSRRCACARPVQCSDNSFNWSSGVSAQIELGGGRLEGGT